MGAKVTGLKGLTDDMRTAAEDAVEGVKGVVSKGSLNIKRDAKALVGGLAHAPAYPRSIGYDVAVRGATVASEIGPDKNKRQGALGNILEYGTRNNAPIPHLNPALDAEEPRFADALEGLGVDLLEGRSVRSAGPADAG